MGTHNHATGNKSCATSTFLFHLLILLWIASACLTAAAASHPHVKFVHDGEIRSIADHAEPIKRTSAKQVQKLVMEKRNRRLSVVGSIGSRPPTCRNKCEACMPCQAIQVPTHSRPGMHRLEYSNYEPEGWKCKCRDRVFNP